MSKLCLIQPRCINKPEHRQPLAERRGKACDAGLFLWVFLVELCCGFLGDQDSTENALTVFRVRVSQSVMKRQDIAHCTVIHP